MESDHKENLCESPFFGLDVIVASMGDFQGILTP